MKSTGKKSRETDWENCRELEYGWRRLLGQREWNGRETQCRELEKL